jgi:hypothetical protein
MFKGVIFGCYRFYAHALWKRTSGFCPCDFSLPASAFQWYNAGRELSLISLIFALEAIDSIYPCNHQPFPFPRL